jgi:shikimate kinase
VGRLLAETLALPFRDTDADVEVTAGKRIAEIFYDEGEEHFRSLERAAVTLALTEHHGVLSLGGGAVLSQELRAQLKEHHVVFLNVGLAAAARRVGLNRDRPVLALNPRAALHKLMEERLPLYREVADLEVDTDGKTPHEVVAEIA